MPRLRERNLERCRCNRKLQFNVARLWQQIGRFTRMHTQTLNAASITWLQTLQAIYFDPLCVLHIWRDPCANYVRLQGTTSFNKNARRFDESEYIVSAFLSRRYFAFANIVPCMKRDLLIQKSSDSLIFIRQIIIRINNL